MLIQQTAKSVQINCSHSNFRLYYIMGIGLKKYCVGAYDGSLRIKRYITYTKCNEGHGNEYTGPKTNTCA